MEVLATSASIFFMVTEILLVVGGVGLLGLAISDFAVTAFVPTGEGPITAVVGRTIYKMMLWLSKNNGHHRRLNYIGLIAIFSISTIWIFLLWAGFTLIYVSDTNSVLVGTDKSPTDTFEKIYHVGYTLSTLGIGDYVPGSDFWRVFTSFVSFVGLVTITMSITYLVPVLSNAIHKRSLSLQISSFGETPEEMVINSYNGKDFSDAESMLGNLSEAIFLYTQNHVAYPILHHMHSNNPTENIVLKLAALDEALTLFLFHVPTDLRPSQLQLQSVRRAVTAYLETVTYLDLAPEPPPLPRFYIVEEFTGVTLERTTSPYRDEVYQALDKRRRLFYADIQYDGWEWGDMQGEKYMTDLDANYSNKLLPS